jgi:hypothetical protein
VGGGEAIELRIAEKVRVPLRRERRPRVTKSRGHHAQGHTFRERRGAADSKIAAHIAAELVSSTEQLNGRLLVLFDADEHTGRFAGARAFLDRIPTSPG